MSPPPARARARAAWSRLPPVRKNGTYNPPINRTSVGDEYGAGNPEVRVGSYRQITRTGGKRDFSPCVYRGLGERKKYATQRNASTREKFVDPTLVDTKAGNNVKCLNEIAEVRCFIVLCFKWCGHSFLVLLNTLLKKAFAVCNWILN